jgi:hypothetical protein
MGAACAAMLAAVPAAGADAGATGARAKHKSRCGHAKAHRTRARCARVRRVRVREAVAERLSPSAPGDVGGLGGGDEGGSGGGGSGGGSTPALGRFVSVSAREWSFTLSRPIVGAGSVTVELRNVGEDPHNLVVSPDDGSHLPLASWADSDPGTAQRQSVTLGAGRYQLWCSLPDHEQQGMSVDLVVQ